MQTTYNTYNTYNVFYNYIEAKNNDGKTHGLNQATYSTELCSKLFDIYADEGYVVYDPFMGTGTTANACVLNGLNYIGSELSTKQCEYAESRIEDSLRECMVNDGAISLF